MAQARPEGCCYGTLSNGAGWDGIRRQTMGYCEKKPRPGRLTCWWHRSQEAEAQRLKSKDERNQ